MTEVEYQKLNYQSFEVTEGDSPKQAATEQKVKLDIDNNKPQRNYKQISRLLQYTKQQYRLLLIGNTFLTVNAVIQTLLPKLSGDIIDSITKLSTKGKFNEQIIYFLLLGIFFAIIAFIKELCFCVASERIIAQMRTDIFESIIQKDVEFFDQNKTGELLSRINSDTSVVESTATIAFTELITNGIQVIVSFCIIFWISSKLTILMLLIIPAYGIVGYSLGKYRKQFTKIYQESFAVCVQNAEEAISNIRVVKSFSQEQKEWSTYSKYLDVCYQIGKKLVLVKSGSLGIHSLLGSSSILLVTWYGGCMVVQNEMSIGELTSFMIYAICIGIYLASISSTINQIYGALGACQKIFEIIDHIPKITIQNTQSKLFNFQGNIQFNNVNFSYPTKQNVITLHNLSLNISSGQVIGIVGSSGSGKSTIVSLIERFYNTSSGQILLDGQDIKSINLKQLHQHIGYVAQEPTLFSGTIQQNITYGVQEEYTQEDIDNAARMANAYDFIMNQQQFPQGYSTLVGERGVKLSGGQKQRIAIARALIKQPKILIFDEATSALDSESEFQVQQAIDKIIKSCNVTMIIIAHRLSSVINCHKILVVDQQTIVEEGTHQELMANGSIYKMLVQRQTNDTINQKQINLSE